MNKSKITNLNAEIITLSETLMEIDDIEKALEVILKMNDSKVRNTMIKTFLEKLEKLGGNASSIWWRALEIRKELTEEPEADSDKSPEQELAELEEVTENDLPFC